MIGKIIDALANIWSRKRWNPDNPFDHLDLMDKTSLFGVKNILEHRPEILDQGLSRGVVFSYIMLEGYHLDPPEIQKTQDLRIVDPGIPITVNWEKFPELRRLWINVKDINVEGIASCTKLTYLLLDLRGREVFPPLLANLPNLEILKSSLRMNRKLFFESSRLSLCLCRKDFGIESNSQLLQDVYTRPHKEYVVCA